MKLTDEERELLICLIENEIESDLDYLNDVEDKEKENWKKDIFDLRNILIKLKPIEIILN